MMATFQIATATVLALASAIAARGGVWLAGPNAGSYGGPAGRTVDRSLRPA